MSFADFPFKAFAMAISYALLIWVENAITIPALEVVGLATVVPCRYPGLKIRRVSAADSTSMRREISAKFPPVEWLGCKVHNETCLVDHANA